MTLFLGLAFLFAADDPKGVPTKLKGDWMIEGVSDGNSVITLLAGRVLKISDDSVEWKAIPKFSEKPGKAKLTAKGKGNEGTLEMKVGEKVYKGIYTISEGKNDKRMYLKILLAPEGKPAPKAFSKDLFKLPSDAKLQLSCRR